jgi:hypothetical protein
VWLLLAVIAASPLTALVYAANPAHLNDPERVALPIGLLLWLVLAAVAADLLESRALGAVALAATVVCLSVGTVVAYHRWSELAGAQQELIAAAGEARDLVPADQTLVVADSSGRYGDVYLLLPPHLDMAVDLEYGTGPDTILCTVSGVPRDHPTAALFPLETTPDCVAYLGAPGVAAVGSAETDLGLVQFFAVPVP